MPECWKCHELQPQSENYCGSCGLPQKPKMAASSFMNDFRDFIRGTRGISELVGMNGIPKMTAEGLEEYPNVEVSKEIWQERFDPSPLNWLVTLVLEVWLDYYDLTIEDIREIAEKHDMEFDSTEDSTSTDSLTTPNSSNENCPCGKSLPSNPPEFIARWNEAMESTAVCYDCFGEINTELV